jgi:hypothetical protein
MTMAPENQSLPSLHCSFCGKEQSTVKQLIVGPHTTCICDECIAICQDAIQDKTWVGRWQARWRGIHQRLSLSLLDKHEWHWLLLLSILILQVVTLFRI